MIGFRGPQALMWKADEALSKKTDGLTFCLPTSISVFVQVNLVRRYFISVMHFSESSTKKMLLRWLLLL